jgi:hypothetical protein
VAWCLWLIGVCGGEKEEEPHLVVCVMWWEVLSNLEQHGESLEPQVQTASPKPKNDLELSVWTCGFDLVFGVAVWTYGLDLRFRFILRESKRATRRNKSET